MLLVSFALFLAMIVLIVVTLRVGAVRLGRSLGEATSMRHRAAESILDTGRVPEDWMAAHPPSGAAPTADEARRYLTRLDGLVRYFRRAPVFDSESTRATLLDGLAEVRERWARGLWGR